jgi:hypothetical protein
MLRNLTAVASNYRDAGSARSCWRGSSAITAHCAEREVMTWLGWR